MSPRPATGKLIVAALLLGSTLTGLVFCEMGVRLFNRYGASRSPAQPQQLDAAAALRYVARLPIAAGTDRRWFAEDPPPLPNRSRVPARSLERFRDYRTRGIFGAQADYIWNSYYVESERCAVNGIFRSFPDRVLAFKPPAETSHPRFRFPPNSTSVAGLVTNEFGFRGHPLTLAKPAKTIRIAFVGASTTVGFHAFAFSYPEYVEAWLNRYAQANHLQVRFEAINAGREGLNSRDIAAIVQHEVLPLDPDMVVYYEGSNQFRVASALASPAPAPPRDAEAAVEHKVPELIRTHLAIGDLVDLALTGFPSLREPRKPAYLLNWGAGVDERNPDVDSHNLPLNLPRIVKDLDAIRNSLGPSRSQLVLCSFEWLSENGMMLSPSRHQYIYKQLNTDLWPLRYADIQQLADFQNRVFRRYAASRGVPFLDVAAALPQDPDLFVDAIHMTESGDRVRAWITFQKLVPILRAQIDSGRLPRIAASYQPPPPPSLSAYEMSTRCPDKPTGPLERMRGAIALDTIDLAYSGASVEYGDPVRVTTAPELWSYAASIQINAPPGLARPCYLYLRARVTKGQIGVGTLDRESRDIQLETSIQPTVEMKEVYVPVLFPDRAAALILRNTAPEGTRSQVLLEDASLLTFLKPLPEELVKTIPMGKVELADSKAALQPGKDGLQVTTPPGQGAFAARIGLGLGAVGAGRFSVHLRLRVLEGKIGAGTLTSDGQGFFEEHSIRPLARTLEVILRLPSPAVTGDLIIRNAAPGNVVSKAILERIEVRKAP